MVYRHLATKGFDWGLVSKSMYLDNSFVFTKLQKKYGKVDRDDYAEEVIKAFPDKISLGLNLKPFKNLLSENESLERVILDDSELRTLNDVLNQEGAWEIISNPSTDSRLKEVATEMFSGINPLTGNKDVFKSSKYSSSIPIVVITGTFPPQVDEDGNSYFNPDGCVTVAEFLDSLNAIKFGSNSNQNRKKSNDNVSDEKDFFNEGYQSCCNRFSSPFYNLYTRVELLNPITRLELAYITVMCWSEFSKKYDGVFSGKFSLGINVNWNNVGENLDCFTDGFDYKVSKRLLQGDVISVNIKDYMNGSSITKLKDDIKEGIIRIPFPMFMCLLEINELGLFHFDNCRLDPMKEVSRGELAYFLVRLANIFGGN